MRKVWKDSFFSWITRHLCRWSGGVGLDLLGLLWFGISSKTLECRPPNRCWTQGRQVYENSQTIDESDLEFLPKPTPPGAASCQFMTPLNDATLLKSFLCPSATAVQHFSEAVSNPQRIRVHYSSAFLCAWVLAKYRVCQTVTWFMQKTEDSEEMNKLHQATSSYAIQRG